MGAGQNPNTSPFNLVSVDWLNDILHRRY
jgi:hypothetical protein